MHQLQQLLEDSMEFEVRSYSGRGMYGKSCLGVDLEHGSDIGKLMACIVQSVYEAEPEDIEEICTGLRHMSTDSMGLGQILYFPDIPFDDGGTADDKDKDEELDP